MDIIESLSPACATPVYDTFWNFAAERQEVFFRRLEGGLPPWTQDPIIARHKFTNAYRASDRVSQYLIRNVIYESDQDGEEVFFRTLLFKTFNRIETWELLSAELGAITFREFSYDRYDRILTNAMARQTPIYSAAYIMPSGKSAFGYREKHRNHLRLLGMLMRDEVARRIGNSPSMQEAFGVLRSYPTIGDFLAYQYVTDLNYSGLCDFPETEFVVPGPGARDGLHKCFSDLGGLTEAEVIGLVAERQDDEFEQRGLEFRSLLGKTPPADRLPEPVLRGLQVRTGIPPRRTGDQRPETHQAAVPPGPPGHRVLLPAEMGHQPPGALRSTDVRAALRRVDIQKSS